MKLIVTSLIGIHVATCQIHPKQSINSNQQIWPPQCGLYYIRDRVCGEFPGREAQFLHMSHGWLKKITFYMGNVPEQPINSKGYTICVHEPLYTVKTVEIGMHLYLHHGANTG